MSEVSPQASSEEGGSLVSSSHALFNRTVLHNRVAPLVSSEASSGSTMHDPVALWHRRKVGVIIFISQVAFIIIFGFLVDYGWDATPVTRRAALLDHEHSDSGNSVASDFLPSANSSLSQPSNAPLVSQLTTGKVQIESFYAMFQDVHVMIFVGFGFLMTFLRKYGYSSVGFNFLLAAYVLQWGSIMRGFLRLPENAYRIRLDILSLISADFTAATILISFGVVLGKLSAPQYLIMVLFETVFVTVNEWICYDIFFIKDAGGTITIHLFGGFFGLVLARTIHRKEWSHDDFNRLKYGSHYNDLFSLIGTLFLWMFWPSFNAATAVDDGKYRAIFNTYFSITASCLGAYMISSFVHRGKFSLEIIQNSTLAGGVIVGSVCDMYLYPWGSLVCGFGAGVISALGFHYLSPIMDRKLGFHDTCGVNNLHAIPAFLGTLISAIVAGCATKEVYGSGYYSQFPKHAPLAGTKEFQDLRVLSPDIEPGLGWTPAIQAGYQMAAMGVTLGIAIGGAVLTGMLLRLPFWNTVDQHDVLNDSHHWELPEKMSRAEEDAVRERIGRKSKDEYSTEISVTMQSIGQIPANGFYGESKATA